MAYEMKSMNHVGSHPFNHGASNDSEREYDRLRDLARQEASKRNSCFDRSQQAYTRGDGGGAHTLSEQGKEHGRLMAQYNKQASDFIFRENNAPGRVAADTIDLHGQFVEEAEDILEERIRAAKGRGETHLHVIVGKGNHSPGHIQKIKPRVEKVCSEEGLQFHTEHNEGRIYVNLTGGAVDMGAVNGWQGYQQHGQQQQQQQYGGGGAYQGQQQGGGGYPSQGQSFGQQQQGYQQHSQPGYQQQQHGGGGHGGQQQHHQQNDQNQEIEKLAKKFLPRILRKLKQLLCN